MLNLFFDLDGTISDPAKGMFRAYRYVCEQLGKPEPSEDVLRSFIGPPLRHNLISIAGEAQYNDALKHFRHCMDDMGALFENNLYEEMAGAIAGFQQQGHALYVVTSKATHIAVPVIEHFRLTPYFKRICGAGREGLPPKDQIIAQLMEKEGLPPHACVMIGDREHDIMAATKNGVKAIGVTWGYGSKEELEAAGAHKIVERPSMLRSAVASLKT